MEPLLSQDEFDTDAAYLLNDLRDISLGQFLDAYFTPHAFPKNAGVVSRGRQRSFENVGKRG